MKVAIVTIYDFYNHGNRLQNYALEQSVIKLGNDVTTLAITPKKSYAIFMPLARLVSFVPTMRRIYTSRKLNKECFHNIIIDKFSKKDLKQQNDKFDAFVLGSDQVWNPKCIAYEDISFLKFADKDKCATYAPSFGVSTISSDLDKMFKNGLNHIKYFSVRENEGKRIIEKYCGNVDVTQVLDPTFLLTKKEWLEFAKPVKNKPKDYILTYFLVSKKEYRSKVREIAKKHHLKVVNINSPFCKYASKDPAEFVDLIEGAKLVCTDSFHGHAMSINMQKPFVSFISFKKTKSRISNLLQLTGIGNSRNYENLKDERLFDMDYTTINEKLNVEREKSLDYLRNTLNDIETRGGGTSRRLDVKDKKNCCGCSACASICPKQCISMKFDEEGFWYPQIDTTKCINCGLCERVCPVLHKKKVEQKTPKAYACYNKDLDVRMRSSSGGIFSLLADFVLDKNGVVFGAGFNDKFQVEHTFVEKKEDLQRLRVSKYVQSRIGDSFKQAKKFLDSGRLVLFTGTACQIGGLLNFLGKGYDNLITQDLICHGVPSPKVWEEYVKYRESKAKAKLKETSFRKKLKNKPSTSFFMSFDNNKTYLKSPNYKDSMMKLFNYNKCLRPSCHACAFKDVSRQADITLADFWGSNKIVPKMNDGKGLSLVLIHSQKGQELFNFVKDKMVWKEVDFEKSVWKQPMLTKSAKPSLVRKKFMKDFKKKPFVKVIKRYGVGML